jgi:membrane protease YdiL (CAAX protease family)
MKTFQDRFPTLPVLADWKTIRDLIARHPLLAYVTTAYLISWTAWFCLYRSNLGLFNGFGIIGASGPALAAMLVSALLNPAPASTSTRTRWQWLGFLSIGFLAIIFMRRLWITTDLTVVSGRLVSDRIYPSPYVFPLDAAAAAIAALICTGFQSARQGVHTTFLSLNLRQRKPDWGWAVIALVAYPTVVLLGNAISSALGMAGPTPKAAGAWYLLALDVLHAFLVTLIGGGGLEEPGWRGFALPLLKRRYRPLGASLALAVFWAFWHWPLFWFGFYGGGPLGVFFFLFGCIPIAILFTAIFHWTKSSLPVVIVLHTSINVTPTFLPVTAIASGVWWLLILGVAIWMWRSPRSFA